MAYCCSIKPIIISMTQKSIIWRAFGLTNVGTVRTLNEDAMLLLPQHSLWLVADGMGGHARGEYASQSIVDAITQFTPADSISATVDLLDKTICEVNTKLFAEAAEKGASPKNIMGSTVAMVYANNDHIFCIWAGDSRIYRLRKGELTQMTRDHSFVQDIVDKGMITREQAQYHPHANIITRAVGVAEALNLDVEHSRVEPGDKYLLCTDGLFKDITDMDIARILEKNPISASQTLIDKALGAGANDNVTVVVVEACAN